MIPPEAATSEAAYEAWRENVSDWGTALADRMDRACRWLQQAGVTTLTCRPEYGGN